MRRCLAAVLVSLAAVLALAGPAVAANDTSRQGARQEIAKASDAVDQALAAVKRGDRTEAYKLARSAYLDHFEYVEIPLRLRNPNLVLDTEFKFAQLRNGIRDGDSLGQIRRTTADVRAGLAAVDRELAKKGIAAPAIPFGFSVGVRF